MREEVLSPSPHNRLEPCRSRAIISPVANQHTMTWSVAVNSRKEQKLIEDLLAIKKGNKGAGKGNASSSEEEWLCSKCKMNNWLSRSECRQCGTKKGGKAKGKGKSKGQSRGKSTGRGKGPGTAPSPPSEGAKNRLRQEMDMKAVMLRHGAEQTEEEDGDVEMEEEQGDENHYEEEEEDEEEDEDETLLKEWATWDMDKLRKETTELENVLLHSKKVSLSSVTPHLEHRLALLRSEMKGRGTPGFQLDRASKLLARAKAQREKTEKSITALEEKLRAAKAKLKDDQAKEAAALTAQQQIQEKIAKDVSRSGDGSAEAAPEQDVVRTMAQGIAAKLPHFQGMMSYAEVQITLQKIVAETAQEMQAKKAAKPCYGPSDCSDRKCDADDTAARRQCGRGSSCWGSGRGTQSATNWAAHHPRAISAGPPSGAADARSTTSATGGSAACCSHSWIKDSSSGDASSRRTEQEPASASGAAARKKPQPNKGYRQVDLNHCRDGEGMDLSHTDRASRRCGGQERRWTRRCCETKEVQVHAVLGQQEQVHRGCQAYCSVVNDGH